MADKRLLTLANECRYRADEIRVKARTFKDPDAKQRMRELAETYEELAQRLERAARD
jgi:hypothetical protein